MERAPGRGWATVVPLAFVAATLSAAVSPVLLIFVPLSLLLLALPPRTPRLIGLGAVFALFCFWGPAAERLWYIERGWVLLVGGWFVAFAVLWPQARFLSRALAAIACALASAAVVLPLSRSGWGYVDWVVAWRFRSAAAALASRLGVAVEANSWTAGFVDGLSRASDIQIMLHPALLALASLAGLGVAWWAYRRLSGQDVRPLAPFREFRFNDQLVWLLIGGILLVVLPSNAAALRAGSNVVAFMGVLYVVRGVAVILSLTGLPGLGAVIMGLLAIVLLPMVTLAAAAVGLADTWIDLRARRSEARSSS